MLNLIDEKIKTNNASILVVDDDPINLTIIESLLTDFYTITTANSGAAALEKCQQIQPDLILLDVIMTDMSGLDVCSKIKSDNAINHIPVIFITSIKDQNDQNKCWDVGAVDFVEKPVNGTTLLKRIKVHLTNKLQTDQLKKMSYIDGLTGLYNRFMLEEVLANNILHAPEASTASSIFMIDIDWFKQYNDLYGHIQGDECLKIISNTIRTLLNRPKDVVIRYGGEEILCILPKTDLDDAKKLAETLLSSLSVLKITHDSSPFKFVTVSIGIHTVSPVNKFSTKRCLNLVDDALYSAKNSGRNCYKIKLD